LVQSIGAGLGAGFDYRKLRYDKIIIMTDADVDGAHISTLLLTFFYRYMPQLILRGHVYLAQPPLFRVELGKTNHYALDEAQLNAILDQAGKKYKPEVHRYKGLGEMPMSILKETTMDPTRRKLLRITAHDAATANDTLVRLMGKDPASRYTFIKDQSAIFVSKGGELDV
jgi:DNA gyrase/topoisomerase IV subunit B